MNKVEALFGTTGGTLEWADPWLYGDGWENWRSGGKMVVHHGLTGSASGAVGFLRASLTSSGKAKGTAEHSIGYTDNATCCFISAKPQAVR